MANVVEALAFLERLFSKAWNATEEKLQRALLAALALHARTKAILKDSRATKTEKKTVPRAVALVGKACRQWQDAEHLKTSILSMDLLKGIVADSIGCTASHIVSMDALDILRCLTKLCPVPTKIKAES
jgi:cobalamin biosynthesis protein CbiG